MIFLEILLKTIFMAALIACLTQMKNPMKKSVLIIMGIHLFICIINYALYVYVSKELLVYYMYFTLGLPGFFCFNMVAKYKRFRGALFSADCGDIQHAIKFSWLCGIYRQPRFAIHVEIRQLYFDFHLCCDRIQETIFKNAADT